VAARQEAIQVELEACGEDMERMAALLDELQARAPGVAADRAAAAAPLPACPAAANPLTCTYCDRRCRRVTTDWAVKALSRAAARARWRWVALLSLRAVQEVNARGADLDMALLDKKIDQMMPELGFSPEDNDRLVASYRRASSSRERRWAPARGCS